MYRDFFKGRRGVFRVVIEKGFFEFEEEKFVNLKGKL